MLESIYLTKSKIRAKLLGLLFSNPSQKYYLSELARLAGASIGNVQRELERFVGDGLIQREKRGNLVFYVLNPRHALYSELRSLVLKTVGIEGELRSLLHKSSYIELALIYGSFARSQEKGESDIDILVISNTRLEKFYSALRKLELQFSREINPTVYSSEEFKKRIKNRDSFVTEILKKPYRLLKGDMDHYHEAAAA
ncbi:MAG: nucleotidyltransferase domain-containing protein [Candidatus Omnitrophica bacterium]|nr:nucleotidyltransferase domain-containing protein [Candidatus Omnitrophota bacterium]